MKGGSVPITAGVLAERLKSARVSSGHTQQQVADALGLPRTAIVQIEAANRAVSSLELGHLARLYDRDAVEFLAADEFVKDPIGALFRATPELAEAQRLNRELRRCVHFARMASDLEKLVGRAVARSLPVAFDLALAADRWGAIQQGRYLAEQERNRLNLGSSPVWEIAEIIRSQGVRVSELRMPDEVSGLYFHGPDMGQVIVVNKRHSRARRLFSYAHEYCHLLVDRERIGKISRHQNRKDLAEVRANAFAAHFLMPAAGVHAFLASLGKSNPTRKVQAALVTNDLAEMPAYGRKPAERSELQVHDIVLIAHHFGVSYEAALYQLLNLRLVSRERFELLRGERQAAGEIAKVLRISNWDEDAHWSFTEQIMQLGFEAWSQGEISRNKLLEIAADAGGDVEALREVLREVLREDGSDDPVGADLPF